MHSASIYSIFVIMDNIKQVPSLSLPAIPVDLGAEVLLEILKFNLRIKSMFVGMEFGQYLLSFVSRLTTSWARSGAK